MIHYEELLKVAPKLALPQELLLAEKDLMYQFARFPKWAAKHQISWPVEFLDLDSVREAQWNMFVLARYVAEGERVFRVEPGLARLLLDTNLPKINGGDFGLPFSAFYLEFPGKLFTVPGTNWIFGGCYITDHRPFQYVVTVDFVLQPQKHMIPGVGDFCIRVNVKVPEHQQLNWGDLRADFERSLQAINPLGKDLGEFAAIMAGLASEVIGFVVNSILYATSADPELTEAVRKSRTGKAKPQKRGGRQKPQPSTPNTRQYKLGESIPIEYGAPRATDRSSEAKSDRKVLKRFRVRGHWHWYLHGKGKSLRKHILIKPYMKGPKDVAELLRRKYQLK